MTDNTEKTKAFYRENGMLTSCEFEGAAFVKYNFEA